MTAVSAEIQAIVGLVAVRDAIAQSLADDSEAQSASCAPDDPYLLALLGLTALADHISAHVESMASESPAVPPWETAQPKGKLLR